MPIPKIGSELFINRRDTPEQIRSWVIQFAESRLTIMRLFVFWDLVEPRPNEWDWTQFDVVFDEAAKQGVKVVPTLFAHTPPGWMREVHACQDVGPLEDPVFFRAALDYIKVVVTRYATAEALDSWIVWNEAARYLPLNTETAKKFRAFLAESYNHDIEQLNAVYYQQYERFDQVEVSGDIHDVTSPMASRVQRIDWYRFGVAYLMDVVREFTDCIRTHDPDHPVHVNPHAAASCMFVDGQSMWQIADMVDFMGASVHPVWHATRFADDRIPQAVGYFSALARSASRDKERTFWVSELQGGPAIYSGKNYGCPRPEDIRAWVWESIGRGAEAIVYWCLNIRTHDQEAGEWGLLDQEGNPSRRLIESAAIAETLEQHAKYFEQATPPRARLAIVYSEATMMMGYTFGQGEELTNPRNRQMGPDALCGAFCLFDDLGLEVDFIDEGRLKEEGALAHIELLIVPDCVALESTTVRQLHAFVQAGGSLIVDGLTGWKTPRSEIAREDAGLWTELMGAALQDIEPSSRALAMHHADGVVPGWFNEITLRLESAQPVARWSDDRVAVSRYKRSEGGVAVRIGTHLFQRYFAYREDSVRAFVGGLLPEGIYDAIRLLNPDHTLRLRRLAHPEGPLCVLMNTSGKARTAQLHTGGDSVEVVGIGEKPGTYVERETVVIDLEANSVCLLAFW